jgi:hypothetical protein
VRCQVQAAVVGKARRTAPWSRRRRGGRRRPCAAAPPLPRPRRWATAAAADRRSAPPSASTGPALRPFQPTSRLDRFHVADGEARRQRLRHPAVVRTARGTEEVQRPMRRGRGDSADRRPQFGRQHVAQAGDAPGQPRNQPRVVGRRPDSPRSV